MHKLRYRTESLTDSPDHEKQDKNVRRRVYDAINVLLAMEVLQEGIGKEVGFKKHPSYLSNSLF